MIFLVFLKAIAKIDVMNNYYTNYFQKKKLINLTDK